MEEKVFLFDLVAQEQERYKGDDKKEYIQALENAVYRFFYKYGHQYDCSTVEVTEPFKMGDGRMIHRYAVIPPRGILSPGGFSFIL